MLYGDVKIYRVNVGTLASVATITVAEQAVTVTGVKSGDIILRVVKPTHQAGLACTGGRASADNTVQLQFTNPTAAGITPTASEIYQIVVMHPSASTGNLDA